MSDLLPAQDALYNLGLNTKKWKSLHLSDTLQPVGSTTLVTNLNADLLDGLHAAQIGGGGSHASSHETEGGDKVHFADLEHSGADVTLHDSLTSTPHISQADKDKVHAQLHALDSALDHSGTITDTQHGTRGSGLHTDSHFKQHALDSALDHTGVITDAQHGSRSAGLHADSHARLHALSSVSDHSEIGITSPTDGQFLAYQASTSKWINVDPNVTILNWKEIRWGIPREPTWTEGAESTAPAAGTALVSITVSTGKTGRVFGAHITADEANQFQLLVGATTIKRFALGAAGTVHIVLSLPLKDGIAAGSVITIKNVVAGATGKVYQASLLYDEA